MECIRDSQGFSQKNPGMNKPNADADKPAFDGQSLNEGLRDRVIGRTGRDRIAG